MFHAENREDKDLGVSHVVQALKLLRQNALAGRGRTHKPPKLPSRKVLAGIMDGIGAVLFPNRLGKPDIKEDGLDYFVGHTLDVVLRDLLSQAQLELAFSSQNLHEIEEKQVVNIIKRFAETLPEVRQILDTDINAAYEGDPAARSEDEVLVCYPGIHAILHYRIAHQLHKLGLPLIARIIAEIAHSETGIDIHPGATIGEAFFIDHGTGVVIGETAIIGRHVRIYQAVTLGAKRFPADDNGTLIKGTQRHPIVEDDVVIYAGATILGRITIGRGSTIGGNVWLTHSVPPRSNITQAKMSSELISHPSKSLSIDTAFPEK